MQGTIGKNVPDPSQRPTYLHQGAIRVNPGEEPEQMQVTKYVHSTAGTEGGSVLATLDRAGHEPTVELVPGMPTSRTSVAAALRQGVLAHDDSGRLCDAKTASGKQQTLQTKEDEQRSVVERQQREQQREQANAFGADAFSAEDDNLWAQDIAPLPQHSYDAAVSSTIGAIVQGAGDLDQSAMQLARSAGLEPEMARDYIQQGVAMHERTVARAVAKLGIGEDRLEAFYDHVRGKPQQLQDAIQRMVHMRDMTAWKDLAVDFRVHNPPNLAVFHQRGYETHIDRTTGDVLLRKGGSDWLSLDAIARSPAPQAATKAAPVPPPPPRREPVDLSMWESAGYLVHVDETGEGWVRDRRPGRPWQNARDLMKAREAR